MGVLAVVAAVLLVGLLLNALLSWEWADPVAALVIAAIAVREGMNAWKGDTCCATPLLTDDTRTGTDECGCCAD